MCRGAAAKGLAMAQPSAFVFPDDYDPQRCALIPVPIALVGFVWGALEPLQHRSRWQDDDNFQRGYAAIAALGACMMAGCLDELIESNRQIYRLLDATMNGAIYTVSGDGTAIDPYVYNPPIPLVPTNMAGIEPSLKFNAEKTMRLVDNLTNATTYTDAPDARNLRDMLQDLIDKAAGTGEFDADMLAELIQIAGLLA
jgi:hypothetical protein